MRGVTGPARPTNQPMWQCGYKSKTRGERESNIRCSQGTGDTEQQAKPFLYLEWKTKAVTVYVCIVTGRLFTLQKTKNN